tara:strand:+ start:308 stop:640 length:333 start_codon:yes stop_codon:yes gene_type:complete
MTLIDTIETVLEEAKANKIKRIDIKEKSSFADFIIICEGTSSRHVNSITNKVSKQLRNKVLSVEGLPQADWALIDFGNIIVHIFKPEIRNHYDLEKLWSESSPDEKKSFG